ncbi:wax ester/triacylglycerol synthase family O-acyltransferase [Nocardioides seonyuensis]|uniref:Diacylglycerol O-acyltransferase n=1 Tax=Nocardioides seonyuensis TaxID=2518371 RepID=A0A4P7IFR9_9ACTN|nr:wax ester/triacylglycerol synthase family O-acyltransferase [Nocardioides seonyuensis]QBX56129.1 wax ester/triacylglycerol synthase family O-acyltransferase [Nocardioides seonyuensis]
MVNLIDPTSAAFLLAERRTQPMHVGALQLFEKPEGAGRHYATELYETMSHADDIAPLFLKHPHRSLRTAGQLVWVPDEHFDILHHVRHSALPKPGRIRELFDLCSRLHGQRLGWERPLWESHVIEGLRDGRVAMYTKTHHSLVDGVSAMRLLQSVLTTDPDRRDLPPPWSVRPPEREREPRQVEWTEAPAAALHSAALIAAEAAGLPKALISTLNRSLRNDTSALSLFAPRTIFNQSITGSRRFAAQDWPVERLRAVGKATGTTINDVVMAMCSGALRSYLLDLDALPDTTLVSMVPVGLNAKQADVASAEGGNAVGAVMVQLGTHLADPADRLRAVHTSMKTGKSALAAMSPTQILAMSALGMAPSLLPMLGVNMPHPPFNVIISNVPGPRTTHYFNGARMTGTYPLSIPINGMALNITCASYDGKMCFGLTGCRRTLPSLQRMLTHLDDELAALEKAAGVS